ncbi:MAG: hypothetical protein KC414_09565 [Romboutsia sp.]|nr:hypothetical protein [Romboutsia sp.]
MLVPVRCFTCNKEMSCLYEKFLKMIEEQKNKEELGSILDDLGLTRICCRTVLMTSIDSSNVIAYKI